MMVRRMVTTAVGVLALASAFGLGIAVGQQAPPTDNKGVEIKPGGSIDLGTQGLDGLQGRQFRVRMITVEPGGYAGIHSHKDRPAFAYIVQGTLTEHRQGSGTREYKEGELLVETTDVVHWAENKGSKPALLVAVDIFKP